MIRVGRCKFDFKKDVNPEFEGFTPIMVLTKSSKFGALGPYCLKDSKGRIMENLWQFSKVYPKVPKTNAKYTARNPKIVWSWPEEIHVSETGEPNNKYWKWRKTGFAAKDPVRYPVGMAARKTCLYSLKKKGGGKGGGKLNYVEARKQIYLPIYAKLARRCELFDQLKERLENGENLLIIEPDGPHQKDLEYYKTKYGVGDDFIENGTMLVTSKNLEIMLNDTKHPFGHGYCLAATLLGLVKKMKFCGIM